MGANPSGMVPLLFEVVGSALLVPGFVAALYMLFKKTHETKGIDMDTVTGAEWD